MKFILPLRHGLAAAARRPKLVLLVYLLSLLPAAAVALLAYLDMAELMNDSLFASVALAGERMSVWNDYQRAAASDFPLVTQASLLVAGLALLLHVLVAAGVVEALLNRERRREHPFLLGVGRHGWRFARSAVWFGIALLPLVLAVGASFAGINKLAESQMDGRVHLAGWLAVLVISLLVYMFLDLGYDLSRIAAATHDEGRTFVGFFKALFHALRHPLILAPFWLLLSLLVVGLHLAYVAGRTAVTPENLGHVALVLVVQQLVFLVAAYLRVSLWGGEVAYYQAAGEPRWCGKASNAPAVTDHDPDRDWYEDGGEGEGEGPVEEGTHGAGLADTSIDAGWRSGDEEDPGVPEPTEYPEPAEPAVPAAPAEPAEPTEPAEPVVPAEPAEPADDADDGDDRHAAVSPGVGY